MNIFSTIREGIINPLVSCIVSPKQTCCYVITKAEELRNDPEFFQKFFQSLCLVVQLKMDLDPSRVKHLSRLYFSLEAIGMQDFYRIVKHPIQWLCPIDARAIDEYKTRENLYPILMEAYKKEDEKEKEKVSDNENDDWSQQALLAFEEQAFSSEEEAIYAFAKDCLKTHLESMKYPYADIETFKESLKNHILAQAVKAGYEFEELNLDDLDVPLRHTPFIDRLVGWGFSAVDIGCVGLYLNSWHLIDTAKWALTIGQYTRLEGIKNQKLELWVRGGVTLIYCAKLLESIRKLVDERLTDREINNCYWDAGTSFLEGIYHGAGFVEHANILKIRSTYIHAFGLIAKFVGLVCIAYKVKHRFFEATETA